MFIKRENTYKIEIETYQEELKTLSGKKREFKTEHTVHALLKVTRKT